MRDMLDISDAAIDSLAEEMVGLAGDSDNLLSPDQVSELAAWVADRAVALTRTSYVGLMLAAMNLTQSRFGVTDEALAEGKVSQLSIPFQNLVALFTTLSRLRRSS